MNQLLFYILLGGLIGIGIGMFEIYTTPKIGPWKAQMISAVVFCLLIFVCLWV